MVGFWGQNTTLKLIHIYCRSIQRHNIIRLDVKTFSNTIHNFCVGNITKSEKKCWRTGPYIAIWPSVPWTICYILKFTREMPQINISRSVLWPYIDDKSTNNYTIITDMDGNIRIYGLPTDQRRLYCRRRLKYQLHGPYHDPMAVCLSWYCPPFNIYCVYCTEDQNLTHII